MKKKTRILALASGLMAAAAIMFIGCTLDVHDNPTNVLPGQNLPGINTPTGPTNTPTTPTEPTNTPTTPTNTSTENAEEPTPDPSANSPIVQTFTDIRTFVGINGVITSTENGWYETTYTEGWSYDYLSSGAMGNDNNTMVLSYNRETSHGSDVLGAICVQLPSFEEIRYKPTNADVAFYLENGKTLQTVFKNASNDVRFIVEYTFTEETLTEDKWIGDEEHKAGELGLVWIMKVIRIGL
ncbi:MAG: hypothetical protein LBV68_04015 [Spirochaetaceae bacterium]|jgi:hypothetical protein|nr:hypothetical protein [Spirochaetaceae bacterium]